LESYFSDHEEYPESDGWDGIRSRWGRSKINWIEGLSPDYLPELPVDPERLDDDDRQYLYKSDGKRYKLIAHGTGKDYTWIRENRPDLIDQKRKGWAYGVWSVGAEDW
jgi:hypothetical protein